MSDEQPIIQRVSSADMEIRGGDGRTVYGIAIPFDQEARVNDGFGPYTEVFRRGAFAKTIAERGDKVKLLVNHDMKRLPIGKAIKLREESVGLLAEFKVSATREGDEALELIRDGVLDAFSVGFSSVKHREVRTGVIERTEVRLREISATPFPAYEGAAIAGVRINLPNELTAETAERIVQALDAYRLNTGGVIDLSTLRDGAGPATPNEDAAANDNEPAPATRRLSQLQIDVALRRVDEILKGIK